jgi:hypothetical protein
MKTDLNFREKDVPRGSGAERKVMVRRHAMDQNKTEAPNENGCRSNCRVAYDDCVLSGVTADPCHELYDRCTTACGREAEGE